MGGGVPARIVVCSSVILVMRVSPKSSNIKSNLIVCLRENLGSYQNHPSL